MFPALRETLHEVFHLDSSCWAVKAALSRPRWGGLHRSSITLKAKVAGVPPHTPAARCRRRPVFYSGNVHTHTHTAHSCTITAPFTAPKNNNAARRQGGARLHPPIVSFHIQFSLTLNKCWLYFGSAEFRNEPLGFRRPARMIPAAL